MSVENYVFTSESVSEGHPDKVCDRISDAILDAFLAREPEARVAVETLTTTNLIVLAGEVRPAGLVSNEEIEEIARAAVRDIGYEQDGFHWRDAEVQVRIHGQSAHIAQGVDQDGAGDQGIMFGYACRETPELMPAPIAYSHRILADMAEARRSGSVAGFGPDSKSQISLAYENGRPVTATSVVVSTQHDAALTQDDVRGLVRPFVENVLPDGWMCDDDQFFVNPTGTFVIGGPDGDAGLTGRKIIVDTYGGAAPHGGGARARTRQRSTARRPMPRVTSPKMWWRRNWPSAAPSSSPMRSAWRARSRSISTRMAPARSTPTASLRCCRRKWI